jgi:hypothetical protein
LEKFLFDDSARRKGRKAGALTLRLSAWLAVLVTVVLALPAILVPLGLPPEGDAVDYRIPLIKWILRHGQLPNWPWTMVDDYPLLGELLMVPLYWVKPGLARLVPIAGYLGLGAVGGSLVAKWGDKSGIRISTLFLLGCAWTLALRPVAIQSNLLMMDDLAAAFLLGSFALVLRRKFAWAGALAACALSTRYTTWGTAAFLPFFCFWLSPKKLRMRNFLLFSLIASVGALPFMVRNFLVNSGNPFFPIGSRAAMASVAADNYGRGHDLLSFLLLPWDILYTNTFVEGFFDYTVGKLFYVQGLAVVLALAWRKIGPLKFRIPKGPLGASLLFSFIHLVIWFLTGQQMRFLVPSLVIWNLCFLYILLEARLIPLAAVITILGIFSAASVQKDSILLALGKQNSIFEPARAAAAACFDRVGVEQGPVGFVKRQGILGYFDFDFVFLPGHPYGFATDKLAPPSWIYSLQPRAGYEPWPRENPCILKRSGA